MKKFSVYYWFRVLFNHTAIVVCERISAFILVVFSPHIVNTPILHKSYTLPTASHQSQQTRFLHTTSRNLSHPAVISIIIITVITFKLVNGGVKWNKSTCALEAEEEKINHRRIAKSRQGCTRGCAFKKTVNRLKKRYFCQWKSVFCVLETIACERIVNVTEAANSHVKTIEVNRF